MTVSEMLYWFIGLTCGLMMIASYRNTGLKSLWFWESLALLGLCIVSATTSTLLYPAVVLWGILFVVPIVGFSYLQRQVAFGHYQRSQRIATLLRYFHPGDGWTDYPDILQALVLVQRGQRDLALSILRRFQQSSQPMALHAMITLFRLEGRWQDCLNWIESLPPSIHWQTSPILLTAYGRSLGERQDYARLFELLEAHWHKLQQQPKVYNQLILIALAFGGECQALQRFFARPQNRNLADTQAYWIATAAMTAGHMDFAQAQFQQLQAQAQDLGLRQAAERRLRSPLKPSRKYLSQGLRQKFLGFALKQAPASDRYDFSQRYSGFHWVTWTLLAANLGMFGLELKSGATTDPEALYRLGALLPEAVWNGEYWRLIAAHFLHADLLHLSMNMAGLWVLGPFIERVFGWFRFLLIYAASGLGAGICIAYFPIWFGTEQQFTIGASGAIMGLIGAMAAVMLWGWLIDHAAQAARYLRVIVILIGVQTVFDLKNSEVVSVTGHMSGLITGFLITVLVIVLFGFKQPSKRAIQSLN